MGHAVGNPKENPFTNPLVVVCFVHFSCQLNWDRRRVERWPWRPYYFYFEGPPEARSPRLVSNPASRRLKDLAAPVLDLKAPDLAGAHRGRAATGDSTGAGWGAGRRRVFGRQNRRIFLPQCNGGGGGTRAGRPGKTHGRRRRKGPRPRSCAGEQAGRTLARARAPLRARSLAAGLHVGHMSKRANRQVWGPVWGHPGMGTGMGSPCTPRTRPRAWTWPTEVMPSASIVYRFRCDCNKS